MKGPIPFALITITLLSSILIVCQIKKDPNIHVANSVEKIPASDLHPCEITGTQLTAEDCIAARQCLNQVRKGTAAVSLPKWMLQGHTKVVTLAVGTMPPPEKTVNARLKHSSDTSLGSVSDSNFMDSSAQVLSDSQPTFQHPPVTPHAIVSMAGDTEKVNVIDYYPLVGKRMSAELTGDGFDIKPLFDRNDQLLMDDAVTTWEWKITARDYGKKMLIIKTNVVMINSQGNPEPLTPTTEYKQIEVYIGFSGVLNWIKSLPEWLKGIAAILAGVSAITGAWKALTVRSDRSQRQKK